MRQGSPLYLLSAYAICRTDNVVTWCLDVICVNYDLDAILIASVGYRNHVHLEIPWSCVVSLFNNIYAVFSTVM
jgi:hypothetical protein